MDELKSEVFEENPAEETEDVKASEENAAEETVEVAEEAAEQEAADENVDSSEEAAEDPKETTEEPKKGFFKKDKEKEAFKEKIGALEDQVKRQMAEFDNFRKRSEKEKQAMFEIGARSVIEKILPVVDNFERGLQSVPEEEKGSAFADGMDKIYKQLMTELDNLGVTPIEAVGQPFDPELHNAVMQVQSEEYESGTVAQELQKGYKYHDTVVRHSMVAVTE
ncbi:MAG: nucleotide exchange factor GrpE [Lachnospiraceae bacterium]|nr:nucleotide exchange factor GrpE [Lachnospiraceae bacterium]